MESLNNAIDAVPAHAGNQYLAESEVMDSESPLPFVRNDELFSLSLSQTANRDQFES